MKNILSLLFIVTVFSLPPAWAGPVDIPNQFQAGTRALADQVNQNFTEIETAIDDNDARIDANLESISANTAATEANAQALTGLQAGIGTAGVSVKLDGTHVGRFLRTGRPSVVVNVDAGTELVAAGAIGIANTGILELVSDTGYLFTIVTGARTVGSRRFVEGELDTFPIFYDDSTCTGNRYLPVEGNTGFFTSFVPGTSDLHPFKPWALRQGAVWASPDPNDENPAYMIRRGQSAQVVPLLSLLVYAEVIDQPFCVDVTNMPGFDVNNPDHVNNTAFAVEPADPVETAVVGRLGGEITLGL